MKCALFTLANWIYELREIVEGSEKTSARFKRGTITIKFSLCKIFTKIPTRKRKIE